MEITNKLSERMDILNTLDNNSITEYQNHIIKHFKEEVSKEYPNDELTNIKFTISFQEETSIIMTIGGSINGEPLGMQVNESIEFFKEDGIVIPIT